MNDPIGQLRSRLDALLTARENGTHPARPETQAVEYAAAELMLLSGVGTAAMLVREPRDSLRRRPLAWGAALLGAAAAAAHLVHAATADERARQATRLLDVAAIAAGVLGTAEEAARGRGAGGPALAGLTLASAGILGVLLDRAASRTAAHRQTLTRRARVVERLVPRSRPRLDRIVVHV